MYNFFQSAHNSYNRHNIGGDLSAHGKRKNTDVGRKADYMKKLSILLATMMLMGLLTACGGTKENNSNNMTNSPSPAVTDSPAPNLPDSIEDAGETVKEDMKDAGDTMKDAGKEIKDDMTGKNK